MIDHIEEFRKAVERGDKPAVEFMKWQWTEMILSDMHYRISTVLEKRARLYNINIQICKKAITGLVHNAKLLDKWVVRHVSKSEKDEYFQDRADTIQEIIEDIMFLNKDSLLKVHSHIKQISKDGAFIKERDDYGISKAGDI